MSSIVWSMSLIIIVLFFTISSIFTHTLVPGYDQSITTIDRMK